MRIVWSGVPSARAANCRPSAVPRGDLRRSTLDVDAWMDATFREFAHRAGLGRPAGEERVRLRSVVIEQSEGWLIACEVPGVPRDSVAVEVEGQQLVVTARRALEGPAGFVRRAGERRGSVGVARFELPEHADREQIHAALRDGVLEVRVGRRTAAPRRVIAVESAQTPTPDASAATAEVTAGNVDVQTANSPEVV